MRKRRGLTTVMINNPLTPITSTTFLVSAVTRLSRRSPFLSLVLVLLCLTLPGFCSSTKLPPKYSEWLKKDVVYIISNEERDTFRNLASDEARERFIEHFWEIRTPNPD